MRRALTIVSLALACTLAPGQDTAPPERTTSFAIQGRTFAAALEAIQRDLGVSLELRGDAAEQVIPEFVADHLTLERLLFEIESQLDWVAHRDAATNSSFIDLYTFEQFIARCHPDGTMETSPELATVAPRAGMLYPAPREGMPSDPSLGLGPGATDAERQAALQRRQEEIHRLTTEYMIPGVIIPSSTPAVQAAGSPETDASPEVARTARFTADHPSREIVREMREHILDTFVPLPSP